MVRQLIEIIPHPFVNCPFPALKRKMRVQNCHILQDIVGYQNTSCSKKRCCIRQIAYVLPFRRIHEDKIVLLPLLYKGMEHVLDIPVNRMNPVFPWRSIDICTCLAITTVIFFHRINPGSAHLGQLCHQHGRVTHRCTGFKDRHRLHEFKK